MNTIPNDLLYTSDHEWIKKEGNHYLMGISHFAQDQLGDIVFVEMPEVGRVLKKGETFGVVESVKTVSDLFSPLSGEVIECNPQLSDNPALVNSSPYGEGWILKLKPDENCQTELNELLSPEKYKESLT